MLCVAGHIAVYSRTSSTSRGHARETLQWLMLCSRDPGVCTLISFALPANGGSWQHASFAVQGSQILQLVRMQAQKSSSQERIALSRERNQGMPGGADPREK